MPALTIIAARLGFSVAKALAKVLLKDHGDFLCLLCHLGRRTGMVLPDPLGKKAPRCLMAGSASQKLQMNSNSRPHHGRIPARCAFSMVDVDRCCVPPSHPPLTDPFMPASARLTQRVARGGPASVVAWKVHAAQQR